MSDKPETTLPEVVARLGKYPLQAFLFVQEGLQYTAEQKHGPPPAADPSEMEQVIKDRHVSGRELCFGLRDLARKRWGRMAAAVLRQWNITRTEDFGEIVFALVSADHMRKTAEDSIEDFHNVYGFTEAFEENYEITLKGN